MKKISIAYALILTLFIAGSGFAEDDPTIVFYKTFTKTLSNAQSLDELKPFLSEENAKQLDTISKEDEKASLELIKAMKADIDVNSITSKVEGDTAVLTVEAVGISDKFPIEGTVTLIKENGDWKLVSEDYTTSVVVE